MDLNSFTIKDVYLSAITSEIEASNVYRMMAEKAPDEFLKTRLEFLSKEEVMHAKMLKKLYLEYFPSEKLDLEKDLPEFSPVPMPNMIVMKEGTSVKAVYLRAIEAEKAASQFYMAASNMVDKPNAKMTLFYFSRMEMTHADILKSELARIEQEGA